MSIRRTVNEDYGVPDGVAERTRSDIVEARRLREDDGDGGQGSMLADDITQIGGNGGGPQQTEVLRDDRAGDWLTADEFAANRAAREAEREAEQAAAEAEQAAIEAAHAAELPYYVGTETIDGEEVEVYLMPDGSTAYYDPDTEVVVAVEWPDDETRDAAMEAAHEAEEAFYDGITTIDGEEVEIWYMPDGSIVYYDRSEDSAVAVEWPDGGPEYQGQVVVDGESYSLYEYPDGSEILVDSNGQVVDNFDDVEPDTFWHEGLERDVYAVPQGPPTWDTVIYDADTGQPLETWPTGKELPGTGQTIYEPEGEDYFLLLDGDGEIIAVQEIPPDENWSLLGIVTSYDDGTIVVDLGAGEIVADISAEGGIWFESDGLGELFDGGEWFGTVDTGLDWGSDGIEFFVNTDLGDGMLSLDYEMSADWSDGFTLGWDVDMEMDVGDLEADLSIDLAAGLTSDGQLFADASADVSVDVLGLASVDGSIDLHGEAGLQGIHASAEGEASAEVLGVRAGVGAEFDMSLDGSGLSVEGNRYVDLGIDGIGGLRSGGGFSVESDGTLTGTSARAGGWTDVTDADGDVTERTYGYRPDDDSEDGDLPGWDDIVDGGPPVQRPDGSADMDMDLDDPSRGMRGEPSPDETPDDGERPWDSMGERPDRRPDGGVTGSDDRGGRPPERNGERQLLLDRDQRPDDDTPPLERPDESGTITDDQSFVDDIQALGDRPAAELVDDVVGAGRAQPIASATDPAADESAAPDEAAPTPVIDDASEGAGSRSGAAVLGEPAVEAVSAVEPLVEPAPDPIADAVAPLDAPVTVRDELVEDIGPPAEDTLDDG